MHEQGAKRSTGQAPSEQRRMQDVGQVGGLANEGIPATDNKCDEAAEAAAATVAVVVVA